MGAKKRVFRFMNVFHLIWEEGKAIVSKPKNIIFMLAVMCIPLLYAGMFLYAFWNAYGMTGHLPVAVVNQDQGTTIDGKRLNAGNDLVAGLKKNNNFDWQFVSDQKANDGFNNNRYFMVVRIPENFSKNAMTLTDQVVKPANLYYKVNADYNFVASKMAGTGLTELKSGVSAQITKLYAQSMYFQLDKLSHGLSDAAKGSKNLAKGSSQEVDALNQLKNGFKHLMDGVNQFTDGSGKLASGASDLNNGAKALNAGVQQYTGAVSSQIAPGATQLSSGLNQLNNGIRQQNLGTNISSLNSGMQEFYSMIQGLPEQINGSINPAAIGEAAKQQVVNSQTAIENNAVAQAGDLKGQSETAANGIVAGITQSVTQSQGSISQSLNSSLPTNLEPLLVAAIQKANPTLTPVQANALAQGILADPQTKSQLNQLSAGVAGQTVSTINSAISSSTPTIAGSLQSSAENTIGQTAFATAQQVAQETAANTASQIKGGIAVSLQQKDPKTGQTLESAAGQLAGGTAQLAGSNGIPFIISSINQAAQGAQTLNGGLNQLNSNSAGLASGASTLAGSTGTLANGAKSLASGAGQLAGGTAQLQSGTGKLSAGAQKISDGNAKLSGSLAGAHQQLAGTPTNNAHAVKFSQPVTAIDGTHQSVSTFGSGFAPYFISLGLFIGALLLTIVYDLGRPAGLSTNGAAIALSKFFITVIMGIGNSLLVDFAVLKGLGLSVSAPWTFVGFTMLASVTFMAIIVFLAGTFDNIGRFIALIMLILQLVTCGGAYAVQLIPSLIQPVGQVLPMTYSVAGFRNIIDGHQQAMLAQNALVLTGFLALALVLSMISFTIKFHLNNRAPKPAVPHQDVTAES